LDSAQSGLADNQASLIVAQRQFEAAEARLKAAEAQVNEAEANYKKAADDEARYKLLVDKDEIARQMYDTAAEMAAANKATVASRMASVSDARQSAAAAEAAVKQA
jgi:multidrug resistance efflux pump